MFRMLILFTRYVRRIQHKSSGSYSKLSIYWIKLGSFGALKLATLISALQFLLKSNTFSALLMLWQNLALLMNQAYIYTYTASPWILGIQLSGSSQYRDFFNGHNKVKVSLITGKNSITVIFPGKSRYSRLISAL